MFRDYLDPEKGYPFKDVYKEIIIRSPKKGRFFGVQVRFRAQGTRFKALGL